MFAVIDWSSSEAQNPGTPGWWTLAVRLTGETPTGHQRVFHAVGQPVSGGPCPVVIVVEYADVEPQVVTPFEVDIRVTLEGVSDYELIGGTVREVVSVNTP